MPPQLTPFQQLAAERLLSPVVQICSFDRREGHQPHGTALLVEHNGNLFLISARHTFNPMREGQSLYVYLPDQHLIAGQLRSARGTSPVDGSGDELDISVVRLDPRPQLERTPLTLSNLGCDVRPSGAEELAICGFPASKTKVRKKHRQIRARPSAHVGPAISPEECIRLNINPRFRIAMRFHTRKILSMDGRRQRAPSPEGMSGSPIWIINPIDETHFKAGVIGIMTDYVAEHKVLVGTTIAAAVGVILDFDSGCPASN